MAKSPIDFMTDLLKNRKLSTGDKERFFQLAAKEIKQSGESEKRIWAELEILKKAISNENGQLSNADHKQSKRVEAIKKHRPRDVAEFMRLFNDENGLKYLTHKYNRPGPFDINEFLMKAEQVFKEETKKLVIPSSLWAVIKNFAFEKRLGNKIKKGTIHWRDINEKVITEGWSRSEIVDKIKANPNAAIKHPIEDDKFEKLTLLFKEVTRIRSSQTSFQLLEYIKDKLNLVFGKNRSGFNIVIDDDQLRRADFYCHVPSLLESLEIIFDEMKAAKKSDIYISYERSHDGNYRTGKLSIAQKDSYPTKEWEDLKGDYKSSKGSIGDIKANLFGYCDWLIETKVHKGKNVKYIRYNMHTEDEEELPETEAIGFKHILKFYY